MPETETNTNPNPNTNPNGEILVVDDNPDTLRLLSGMLETAGYATRVAPSGELALCSATRKPPDLIVLDVRMHGMNGFETCRCLKRQADTAEVPVIFLSASADPDDRIEGFDAGGVDFVGKPFVESEVLARIRTHMRMALSAKRLRLRAQASATIVQPAVIAEGKARSGGEILIVEDTLASLQLLSAVLREAGYTVREAPNGELALWTASKRPPDLILLDIRMPGMNGFDVCRCLKLDPGTAQIPVIFISALSDSEDKAEGFTVGAVDFITKPFAENEVLARVKTHLRLAAALPRHAAGAGADQDVMASALPAVQEKTLPIHPRIAIDLHPADAGISIDVRLHGALDRAEIELLYQPIFALASGRLVAVEMLLCWNAPDVGMLPPKQFLELAEATGEIVPIGQWALDAIGRQLAVWHQDPACEWRVVVNLSSLEFWQDNLPDRIAEILQRHQLPPASLEFDITADTLLEDLDQGIAVWHRLDRLGVKLALDNDAETTDPHDLLRRLPIDCLKLDAGRVTSAGSETKSDGEIKHLIDRAHHFRITVEGKKVESAQQLAWLKRSGVDRVQGYWLAPPMSAAEYCLAEYCVTAPLHDG